MLFSGIIARVPTPRDMPFIAMNGSCDAQLLRYTALATHGSCDAQLLRCTALAMHQTMTGLDLRHLPARRLKL